jgi:predicted GNAT family acetyltransferase
VYWQKVSEQEFPALVDFLLALEPNCVSFTSRLLKNGAAVLPARREALIYALRDDPRRSGVDKPPADDGRIRGAMLMTSRGMMMPVHQPGLKLSDQSVREITDCFYQYCRKLYCIIGMSETVRQYESSLRERIDIRIRYHLMRRCSSIPLPRVIFTEGLRIASLSEKDIKSVYHLEVEYQHEEVLVHPERFSSAAHLVYFRNTVREQYILYAKLNGTAVGKAGTNAIGFHNSQIGGVFTAGPYRGRGIARALMIRLLEEIHGWGMDAVLFVRKTNKPAVRLYENLDFDIIGEYQITYTQLD